MTFEEERERLLEAAVEQVLAAGPHLSNRALAGALGTSHRMLDYYFGGRDSLVEAVITRLSDRLRAGIPLPEQVEGRAAALHAFASAAGAAPSRSSRTTQETVEATAAVWTEVLAAAARGREPFVTAARRVVAAWHDWLVGDLGLTPEQADAVVAAVEGAGVLRLTRGHEAASAALRLLLPAAVAEDGA